MSRSIAMLKPILILVLLVAGGLCFVFAIPAPVSLFNKKDVPAVNAPAPSAIASYNSLLAYEQLYDSLDLDNLELSRQAFTYAVQGFYQLQMLGTLAQPSILSIVDFSLPSTKKRLYIIDMANRKLLFNTFVAHGKNSGKEMATRFSNQLNSFKSSLGFYITGDTYMGQHGYSLKLQGLEKGINDNAYNRSIVLHGAGYVNEKYIGRKGFIGRSLGCPAVPEYLHKPIIETVKNGTCMFIYGPDKYYTSHSALLKSIMAG